MLPPMFSSRRLVVCWIGSRLLSTKSRYSDSALERLTSKDACTSRRDVTGTFKSRPNPGALKSFESTVNRSVTKSYQSLLARVKSQLPRTVTEAFGRSKRKSGADRGTGRFWPAAGAAIIRTTIVGRIVRISLGENVNANGNRVRRRLIV